ncbi:carbohydrate kinase family protein [candidate division WWE3 bacterium]|uniref:Carbohydrate kinase family protein n=1 Tax=candidate division WWE3 bacterium TaxID=2053526 RepID=A0A955EBZ7_UNCKA|nr:carbohydrate kinase family protein [candidate division WWE3 bacterium]
MAFDLLVIGDVSIDQYMKVSKNTEIYGDVNLGTAQLMLPYGSKIPVDDFGSNIAGNSCNVAMAVAKTGLKVGVYTEMGDDTAGRKFREEFRESGINVKYCLLSKDEPTNVHTIIVKDGERTILSYHRDREYNVQDWETPKWLYYTSMPPKFQTFQSELIEYIKQNPKIGVAFNPGTYHLKAGLESIRNFLEVTDILFVNKEEAIKLVGNNDIEDLHKNLQNLGPKMTVITEGKTGSSVSVHKEKAVELGVFKDLRPIVDKTGAGDAHSGGFLAAILHGKSLEEALKWGTLNSSSVIRQVGSVNGQLTLADIEETLKHNPKFE